MAKPYSIRAIDHSQAAADDLRWYCQVYGRSTSPMASLSQGGGGGHSSDAEPWRFMRLVESMHSDRPRYYRVRRALDQLDLETVNVLWSAFSLRAGDPPEVRAFFGDLIGIAVFELHTMTPRDQVFMDWLVGRLKKHDPAIAKARSNAEEQLGAALTAYELACGIRKGRRDRQRRSPLERVRAAIQAKLAKRAG